MEPSSPFSDILFVGRPSSSGLQQHTGRRSKDLSRPGTAKPRLQRAQLDAGIPRASSVPLLLDCPVNLEIHSTPVSLATRSLSNHLATSVPSNQALRQGSSHRTSRGSSRHSQSTHPPQSCKHPTKGLGKKQTSSKSSRGSNRRRNMAAQFRGTLEMPQYTQPNTSASTATDRAGESGGGEDKQRRTKSGECATGSCDHILQETAPTIKGLLQSTSESARGGEERRVEGESGEVRKGGDRVAAAQRIQEWYRNCHRKKRQQCAVEVASLLREKREELNHSRSDQERMSQRQEVSREQEEKARRLRREEKMRAARQAAIQSLQKQREERRREGERVAQEEIALLQASGKIKRMGDKRKRRKRKEEELGREEKEAELTTTKPESERTVSPSQTVPDSVITEFFNAGSSRKPQSHSNSQASSEPHMSLTPHPPSPPATPKAANTYTDILDTLRLLEEAPPPLRQVKSREAPPINKSSKSKDNPMLSLSQPDVVGVVGGVAKQNPASSSLSESKLQSILSYLDEVERTDSEKTPRRREQRRAVTTEELEEATAVATDVTTTILSQRMEIDNKNKTVEMLQKALNQQRELTVYHAREMEKEGERRLELQKQEYESTVRRHQSFIDQLIEDKKTLGERCEQLVKDLKETSTKYQAKIKSMEETHTAELSKVKQVAAAADKLRRERWRVEESQRIKAATVRSLEPEIQRIIQKGKADIQRLKTLHEAELVQADERAGRRFVAQMEELRAQCAAEKEQACAHERELARQRYEKLAEQEEISAQQQRRRLFAEIQAERDKMAAQWNQQKTELEKEKADALEAHAREMDEVQREHSRVIEEAERRHSSQLRAVEERLATEREAWQENYTSRQEITFLAREREMRESLRKERDKEIEMVISRLEEEAENTRSQTEKTADARIRRIREKCEAELSEIERSERNTQEKLTLAKQELGEREGELARVRSLLAQREEEVRQVGEVVAKLSKERDNVTDIVRQEFADRLVLTEDENKRLKIEMSEQRARHRLELERAQQEKEKELEEVHSRVRQALVKKEENLTSLRSQHEAALKRAEHLEMLLERQRRELLKKH